MPIGNELDNYPAGETDPYEDILSFPDEIMRKVTPTFLCHTCQTLLPVDNVLSTGIELSEHSAAFIAAMIRSHNFYSISLSSCLSFYSAGYPWRLAASRISKPP